LRQQADRNASLQEVDVMGGQKMDEDRRGMLIGGVITLGVGIILLLSSLRIIPGVGEMWPLFVIIVGISLIIGSFVKGKKSDESKQPPA
jgi:uncharacterized membrane protein HdeD (DUF308 family)